MKSLVLALCFALQPLQQPASTLAGQPVVERPNAPDRMDGERHRHSDWMIAHSAAGRAKPKRCRKTLWLKPCPVTIKEMK